VVYFGAHCGLKPEIAPCPKSAITEIKQASEQTIALARLRFVSAGPNATPLPLLDRRQ
jgi:hypothetical protein